jgi:hypothetical protein
VEKLRKISLLMLMSLLLVAGMLASSLTPTRAQYLKNATAKFYMRLPNRGTWDNATGVMVPGSKFNLTIGIANVTQMTAYGITFVWNSDYVAATGRYWLSSFFEGELLAGNWSAKSLGYITNDLASKVPPAPATCGALVDFGQTALGAAYNVTGTFDIVTVEFQAVSYGPEGFYLWKDPSNYGTSPPYSGWIQPYLQDEYAFSALYNTPYWITSSGWLNPSGSTQDYDVVWCSSPLFAPPTPSTGKVANAVLWINSPAPHAPVATVSFTPASPLIQQTVKVTVTQTSAGFNGTATFPITNVTIYYGDSSPLQWKAPNATGVATFTHNYTALGLYTIKAYCYAAGMPSSLAWDNVTVTPQVNVVPEFPAYLLMPLFFTTTIIAVAVAKMWSKKPKGRVNVK